VQYKGIEYVIRRRSDGEWAWTIKAPIGPEKAGYIRGTNAWARTVVSRAIDVWLLMNPQYSEPPTMTPRQMSGSGA
jgi:hypothetical protein